VSQRSGVSAAAGVLVTAIACLAAPATRAAVTCTASAVGVAFGAYNPLAASPATSTGSILVSCTSTNAGTTTINLTASYSTGSSGTYLTRTMRNGANSLNYNLYFDAAYTRVRGDGTGGTQVGTATLVLRRNETGSASGVIYGRLPAGQEVAPGAYADTITVTVAY